MNDFLKAIDETTLDARTKGMPLAGGSLRLAEVGRQGWNVLRGDMLLPLLTLHRERMRNNMRLMRDFAGYHGVSLAPHGKTTMCPQLYRAMIDEGGAWGITTATVQQAAVAAASGVQRIVIANQVLGRANIEQLVALSKRYPAAVITSLVDSTAAVEQLAAYAGPVLEQGSCLPVLVEVGHRGGRTGARSVAQAGAVIEALTQHCAVLQLAGVEGFEGTINCDTEDETLRAVDAFLDLAVAVFRRAEEMQAFAAGQEVLLSAGGSAFFDRVAAKFGDVQTPLPLRVVLRGGCYLTYDHGLYHHKLQALDARGGIRGQRGPIAAADFTPALTLWAVVQSLQDPGMAIVGMGIRDMPHDAGFPIPLALYRGGAMQRELWQREPAYTIVRSNDQHCYLHYPEGADLRVGDMLACGVSHPCTAFDKWDVLYEIDDDGTVIGALKTFF